MSATEEPVNAPRGRRPLYLEAADRLRTMIADGAFDGVLPSQDQLCAVLNVSRPTVREALRVLERDGHVSTRQGAATVINAAPRVEAGFEELFSASELLDRRGLVPGTTYVDVRRTIGTAASFPGFTGKPVFVIERVRTADGTPFVFSVDVIEDVGYDEALLRAEMESGSLMSWLAKHDIDVEYAKTHLSAASAVGPLAERLKVTVGTPLLLMEESGYASGDDPVYYSNDFYRCDLSQFYIVRRRARA